MEGAVVGAIMEFLHHLFSGMPPQERGLVLNDSKTVDIRKEDYEVK